MSTTINSITGIWTNWVPDDITSPSQSSVSGERIFRWGLPLAGQQAGLGFKGSSPPSQSVSIGQTILLGRVALYNRTILSEDLEEIELEVTVRFNDLSGPTETFTIKFKHTEGDDDLGEPFDSDILEFADPLPIDVEVGDLKLTILGFEDVTELLAGEGNDSSANIRVVVNKTPFEDEDCVDFVPLFQPEGCEVRAVCPIDDGPIIEDCGIPEAPGPITDCPEIDVPLGSHGSTGTGGDGEPGPPGPPGPPGAPGANGCTPRIQVAYSIVFVYDCNLAGVSATVSTCPTTTTIPPGANPDCCYQINFIFYVCWYPALPSYACCPFIWCSGAWLAADSYLCSGVSEPPVSGDYEGEMKFVCKCTTSTTTSTSTSSSTTGPPCEDWMIMICNSNAAVDDNFDVILNGNNIGSLDFSEEGVCNGKIFKTASIPSDLIADGCCLAECTGDTVSAGAFNAIGDNVLEMINTEQHNNGNWGIVKVANVRFNGDDWVVCSIVLDTTYTMPDGGDQQFEF